MAADTKIEWAHHTFNAWIGCTKVSPGCDHCYAERQDAHRRWTAEGWGGPRRRTGAEYWKQPLKWERAAARQGVRHRVFCSSLADVFDNQVPDEWRADLWALIAATPHLDWLLLTKRPQNIAKMLPADWRDDCHSVGYPNVWLGTTAENQTEANRRIPHLLAAPARVRFLSCEPLIGPVNLRDALIVGPEGGWEWWGADRHMLHWVIAGGESGPQARPMHPDWARTLRDQCAAAGVPFFFKQWGEWAPTGGVDFYGHGSEKNQRAHPNAQGIAWLRDGRVCLRDFTVTEHRRRMQSGIASCTRAIEEDRAALSAFHRMVDDPHRTEDNPLGYCWMYRLGKKAAGRMLDGVLHDGAPS